MAEPEEDLNALIRELNEGGTATASRRRSEPSSAEPAAEVADALASIRLDRWLEELVARKGSDLLLVAGAPPSIRTDGRIAPLPEPPLAGEKIEEAVLPGLPRHARAQYREAGIADASHRVAGVGRFRVNLHRERGRAAATLRALPTQPPRLATLGLPPGAEGLTRLPRGLVLVGGPTGSGKTTTLAALVEEINRRDARHVVTIEDPIEYEHPHRTSLIEQVEIGIDAPDFPTALRAALRQAPDVLVVGEMRDPETMRIALAAAETGHLVFSTLHTTDVASTISRIADSFPPERQSSIRQELAMSLAAVLTQILLPSKRGGRYPAAEMLLIGYGARVHIRKNNIHQLHQEITMTKKAGSFSLEESLVTLMTQGHIDREDAMLHAIHPDDLEGILRVGAKR